MSAAGDGEERQQSDILHLKMSATNLMNLDRFDKSDPYLAFSRIDQDGSRTLIAQTSVIQNNLNPEWASVAVNMNALCYGDKLRPFRIECWDSDADDSFMRFSQSNKDDLIGWIDTNFRQLEKNCLEGTNDLILSSCPQDAVDKNAASGSEPSTPSLGHGALSLASTLAAGTMTTATNLAAGALARTGIDLHLNRPHNPGALRCDKIFLQQKDDVVPGWVTLSNAHDGEGKQQGEQSFTRTFSHEKSLQEVHQEDAHLADERKQPKTAHDGLEQRHADRRTDVRKALQEAWHVGKIDRKVLQDFYQQKSSLTSAPGTRRGGMRLEALKDKAKSMDPTTR